MGTRGNRIQLYITMGTVFTAFCDGGPLRWRTGTPFPTRLQIANFQSVFARSASAATPTEKVQLTLSQVCAF